jgi:hypothetical protein
LCGARMQWCVSRAAVGAKLGVRKRRSVGWRVVARGVTTTCVRAHSRRVGQLGRRRCGGGLERRRQTRARCVAVRVRVGAGSHVW